MNKLISLIFIITLLIFFLHFKQVRRLAYALIAVVVVMLTVSLVFNNRASLLELSKTELILIFLCLLIVYKNIKSGIKLGINWFLSFYEDLVWIGMTPFYGVVLLGFIEISDSLLDWKSSSHPSMPPYLNTTTVSIMLLALIIIPMFIRSILVNVNIQKWIPRNDHDESDNKYDAGFSNKNYLNSEKDSINDSEVNVKNS
ncbi:MULTISPECIES: hypothetical protein [unclassified Oceanobacter]|uniref:hypothetical protein n=1 Tax=unclassified Oceanobacter TaxID=2620260 RepID=UPI0027353AF4|nr:MULTISPECIES: hypothetical protein [unclassified Oceanobacter]MDP2505583.1 hypothetical protein [Oceanobacter sp. 3_MG-2023]MDP2547165.1 hypothetical protein [Oceanobacter sp. 4_MG-2023]